MVELCSSCGKGELKELVPGVRQCSVCKKIFKDKIVVTEKVVAPTAQLLSGEYFMKEHALNPKWEIADMGITIEREENKSWYAVVMCHSPEFEKTKIIRLSWWKKSINEHAGMFKMTEMGELDNTILALERIDEEFDENFEPKGKITDANHPSRPAQEIQLNFDMKKKECPKCKFKMKFGGKNKRFLECERCGEIVVLENQQPVMDIPSEKLPLCFSGNFPVNYYLPYYGISVRVGMAEWKAIVIIYAKENPSKKWLRFYWWARDLQAYITSPFTFDVEKKSGLGWEAKKGTLSPNIYEKRLLKPTIDALKKMKEEWQKILPKEEELLIKPKSVKKR